MAFAKKSRKRRAHDFERENERPVRQLEKDPPALEAFKSVWTKLMTTPIHLDSALSKVTPKQKTVLAQILPRILAQPLSLCEHFGVGVPEGEPWSLTSEQLSGWRPAVLLAECMMKDLERGIAMPEATENDFPPLMIQEWKRDWAESGAKRLYDALIQSPPLSLRISRRVSREEALKELKKGSDLPVRASLSTASPLAVRLEGYAPIMHTRLFEEGLMEIQDEGSQFMALFALAPEVYAPFLSAEPQEAKEIDKFPPLPSARNLTIVDACAGAGGKALAFADLMEGKGRVYGYDVFESKVAALKKRAKRSKLNNLQGVLIPEHAEEEAIRKHHASADLVLVDSPCSGWGVLKRNPDIKWRGLGQGLDRLPELQLRLLKTYARLVKPGGKLVYGLCTSRKAESIDVVARFASEHPEFESLVGGFYGPGRTDGFYMHAFQRK